MNRCKILEIKNSKCIYNESHTGIDMDEVLANTEMNSPIFISNKQKLTIKPSYGMALLFRSHNQ
jgi:hypothetical protein